MSDGRTPYDSLFESIRRDIDPKKLKRAGRTAAIVAAVFVAGIVLMSAITPSTEYLWFLHDARHPEVFTTGYGARGMLFAVSFVVGWVVLYVSLRLALNFTMVFLKAPESRGQMLVTNAIGFVQSRGGALVRFGSPVLAFFSALDFSNEWSTWLLATHSQSFGRIDPIFSLDLSFFTFSLPWYRAVSNFVWALLVLTTLATVAVYAILQGMAALAKIELGGPRVRGHIHTLLGLTVMAFAVQTFLKTYEIGLTQSAQFTGPGYAAMQALYVQRFLAWVSLLVGVCVIANGWLWRPYVIALRGFATIAIIYAVGVIGYPELLQRFRVDPDRLKVEAPYAKNAIDMTRYAYGLDAIQSRAEKPAPAPTALEVSDNQATLDNMRLWDPTVLKTCLQGLQAIRQFYHFYDVDIDRYSIAGKQTLLMLSPRQIDLDGLGSNAQNWTNERLRYTHGYGVVVARVDQATSDGEPVLLDKDMPQVTDPDLAIKEPRIYFGHTQDDDGRQIDEYAITQTGQKEFDYPTSDADVTNQWTGTSGIPIGGFLSRLAFSIVLGDGNLLVSPEIRSDSRLLMHRNVTERATRIYPFLKFDQDPYMVLLNGKILWVLDGYTTTDAIPYSQFIGGDDSERINYIRNSVKVTVDAYTGETNAYSVEPNEPILRAWSAIYPGLIKASSAIPPGLAAHFRYPEDMFQIQSAVLCSYHVQDPQVFLGNGDLWTIASQRGLSGDKEQIKPFYVEVRLPDDAKPEFVQILPFTPNGRINMTGWIAARCDPGSYGKMTLYTLDQSTPIAGPEQMEGSFSTKPEISNINRQFQNEQSRIIVGNLLVIPIGNSFMYAESLFLKSNTQDLQAVPRLVKVILALNSKVVVADTYRQGLADLFGNAAPAETSLENLTSTPTTPIAAAMTPSSTAAIPKGAQLQAAKQVLDILDKADAALRSGDFAQYGELQKQAKARLKAMLNKP